MNEREKQREREFRYSLGSEIKGIHAISFWNKSSCTRTIMGPVQVRRSKYQLLLLCSHFGPVQVGRSEHQLLVCTFWACAGWTL